MVSGWSSGPGGQSFTAALYGKDRADQLIQMSHASNVDRERPITDTNNPPQRRRPPLPGVVDPNDPSGAVDVRNDPGNGAPPPQAVDPNLAFPLEDDWAYKHPMDTIYGFLESRGGMGVDNPYFQSMASTSGGLNRLWSLMDPSWGDALDQDTSNGLFRAFVDDLFGAGGNVDWNLGTFKTVINSIMSGNLPEAAMTLIGEMDSPAEAMAIINELFEVFAPVMDPVRRRMFQTMLGNVWKDMSRAYSSGTSVQDAFTNAITKVGSVFGLAV